MRTHNSPTRRDSDWERGDYILIADGIALFVLCCLVAGYVLLLCIGQVH